MEPRSKCEKTTVQKNNTSGQTREVNGRRTPRLAVGRQEAEEEGYFYQAVECLFDQICSFGLYVMICYVFMFLGAI